MKYEEFKEKVVAEIADRIPEAFTRLDMSVLYDPDASITYIDKIADDFVQKIKESALSGCNIWSNILMSAEEVKKMVFPVMVNAERNTEFLKMHPHKTFLDLAVVYYVSDGNEYVCITENIMRNIGLTADELHDTAIENISRTLFSFGTMRIVTNETGYLGSGSILKKNLAKEICGKLKCDTFYLFPSSVHEWVVVPTDEIELSYAKEMVKVINHESGCVSKDEWLSDNVYLFDGSEYRIA